MKKTNIYLSGLRVVLLASLVGLMACNSTNFNDVQVAQYEAFGKIGVAKETRLAEESKQKTEQYKLMTAADTGGTTVTNQDGYTFTVENQNPYLYLAGARSVSGGTPSGVTRLPQPIKVKSGWEKGFAMTLGVFDRLALPLSNIAMADIQRKGNTDIARLNNEAILGQAEYNYLERSDMYATFGGMTTDAIAGMESVATTATGDMSDVSQAGLSEMKQVATTYAQEQTAQIEAYTENFRNDTYIQLESYELRESHSESSSDTHTTEVPAWLEDVITVDLSEDEPTP